MDRFKQYFSFFSPNLEANDYIENFFISAVFSIVFIRVVLSATGFPQLGGEGYHIAHMLWGGMLMLTSIIVLLSYLSKNSRHLAATLGGLGFGAFIDELGKLVTHDNNYFFEPTFAYIYIIFVLLFFAIRYFQKVVKPTNKDYAVNAVELLKEVVIYDLDKSERKKALYYLRKSNQLDPLVIYLIDLLKKSKTNRVDDLFLLTRLREAVSRIYLKFIRRKKFAKFLTNSVVIISFFTVAFVAISINGVYSFWNIGHLASTATSGLVAIVGTYFLLRKNYLRGYETLKISLLISIFLSQFFQFYKIQLFGLLGLLFYISIFIAVQFLINQERALIKE
jgi:hypothetical protein